MTRQPVGLHGVTHYPDGSDPAKFIWESSGGPGGGGTNAAYFAIGGSASPDHLQTIDLYSGVTTTIGVIGFAVTGLAFDPTTGTLYGVTSNSSPVSPKSLITIDKTTGAGTLIGSLGSTGVADITFKSDGTLFGWRVASANDLVTINKTTGTATSVGSSGLTSTFGNGLAFDRLGNLYVIPKGTQGSSGYLYRVNTSTGAVTIAAKLIGQFSNGDALSGPIDSMDLSPNNPAFPETRVGGAFWGIYNEFGDPYWLCTISTPDATEDGAAFSSTVNPIWQLPSGADAVCFETAAIASTVQYPEGVVEGILDDVSDPPLRGVILIKPADGASVFTDDTDNSITIRAPFPVVPKFNHFIRAQTTTFTSLGDGTPSVIDFRLGVDDRSITNDIPAISGYGEAAGDFFTNDTTWDGDYFSGTSLDNATDAFRINRTDGVYILECVVNLPLPGSPGPYNLILDWHIPISNADAVYAGPFGVEHTHFTVEPGFQVFHLTCMFVQKSIPTGAGPTFAQSMALTITQDSGVNASAGTGPVSAMLGAYRLDIPNAE